MIAITVVMAALVIAMFVRDPDAARPWRPNIRPAELPRQESPIPQVRRDEASRDSRRTPSDDGESPRTPSAGDAAFIRVVDAGGLPRAGIPVMWRDLDPLMGPSRGLSLVVLTDNDGLASLPRPNRSAVAVPLVLLEEALSSPMQLVSHETVLKTPPLGILDVQLVTEDGLVWQGPGDVRVLVANRDPSFDTDVVAVGVRDLAAGQARFAHVETDALLSIEASVVGGSVAPKLVVGPKSEGDIVTAKLVVDTKPAVTPDRVTAVAPAKGPAQPVAEPPLGQALVMPKVKVAGRGNSLPKWPNLIEVQLVRKGERQPSGGSRLDPRDFGGVSVAAGSYSVSARLWRAGAKGWRVTDIAAPASGWPTVKAVLGALSQPTLTLDAAALADAARVLAEAP